MSKFQFPENCSFCQSRIGSDHCLLPYQFVKQYVLSEDTVSAIVDITEIHTTYGISALESNFNLLTWVRTRSFSRHGSSDLSFAYPVNEQHTGTSNEMNDSSQLEAISSQSTVSDGGASISFSDFITSQLDEDECRRTLDAIQASSVTPSTPTMAEKLSHLREDSPSEKSDNPIPLKGKGPKIITNFSTHEISTDQDRRNLYNHLVQDLVMMTKTAFNLHAKKRGWIRISSLKESIMYESNMRSRLGNKYSPTFNSELDGNIAIAKEIIARHSIDDIQLWQSDKQTSHGNFCFLNDVMFRLEGLSNDQQRLSEELIRFTFFSLSAHLTEKGSNITLSSLIDFELGKANHPCNIAWIKSQYKFLNSQQESRSSESSTTSRRGDPKKVAKEPYPTTDPRLLNYINTHLQVFIVKVINESGNDVPVMSDETKVHTFIFKLANEFLLRNKGWHNENSFTSPHHLEKLEEATGLRSRSSESILTFEILRKTLDAFRTGFKTRYPKSK